MNPHEKCQRCGGIGPDRRRIAIACNSVNLVECLNFPLLGKSDYARDNAPTFKWHQLLVCKHCRADWLEVMRNWYAEKHRERIVNDSFVATTTTMDVGVFNGMKFTLTVTPEET